MKRIHIFAAAALAAVSGQMAAQDINTEITIEREVVPEQRAASRPDVLPRLQLPQVAPVDLALADRSDVTSIPPYMSALQPAVFGVPAVAEQWRGYVSGGYLPVYNLDLSAGYRVWQTDKARADLFGQFNGKNYDHLYRNSFMAGASLSAMAGDSGCFRAMVDFGQSRFNRYDHAPFYSFDQVDDVERISRFSQFDMTLGYDARFNSSADLNVGVDVNMADYAVHSKNSADTKDTNRQWRLGLAAGVNWHYNEMSSWGIDASVRYIIPDYNYITDLGYQYYMTGEACFKKASFRVVPHYRYSTPTFEASAGISLTGMYTLKNSNLCESCEMHWDNMTMADRTMVAPDIKVTWRPSGSFTLWADWSGRGDDNFLGSVYHAMPYADMSQVCGFSAIPVDIKAGVTLGPWRGASLQLRANYANVEDWLMPSGFAAGLYRTDPESVMLGGEFRYDYRSVLSLGVAYDRVVSDDMYYLWRDGAKGQLKASVTVRPLDRLSVGLSWLRRVDRPGLGNMSSVDLNAKYRVNSRLGVFVDLENLLCKRWLLIGGVPSQRLHGLVGATYLF